MKLWIFLITAFSLSLPAMAKEEKSQLTYKKEGFRFAADINGVIPVIDGDVASCPAAKVDVTLGYQLNPYVSLNADLWTVYFYIYGAEFNPKVNFTDSKVSPFITAGIGFAGTPFGDDDDSGDGGFVVPTYSAGAGIDFHVGKRTTVYTQAKYRGTIGRDRDEGTIEMGAGVALLF